MILAEIEKLNYKIEAVLETDVYDNIYDAAVWPEKGIPFLTSTGKLVLLKVVDNNGNLEINLQEVVQ